MAPKIGLLVCDHVLDQYVSINGTYPEMFAKLLPDLNLVNYYVCDNEFPDSLDDCEGYIATGSKYSVYDEIPWIIRLKSFISELDQARKKFVGVCFGHQLLAESTGGKVEKSEKGWSVGIGSFEILAQQAWMSKAPNPVNILMMCQDQVKMLPLDTIVLGKSAQIPYGIIQKGTHMLGIQGHPEFSKAYDRTLMEDRRVRMGNETVRKGIASLEKEVHREVLARWIVNFLAT
jgi:GMP synthase-like glutamine amidotransferase